MAKDIFVQTTGPVANLVLNRPSQHNALCEAMWQAIPDLLADITHMPQVRVLIVRGEGGSFSAGADIREFEQVYSSPERAEGYTHNIIKALESLADFPLPTLAKIQGSCVGGGCAIALACDFRFAGEGSRFAITPAKLGLAYALNDTRRLIDAVGVSNAKDILYSARLLEAEDALTMGLINQLSPRDELDKTVADYIENLLAASPYSIQASKQIISLISSGVRQETDQTRHMFQHAFQGNDFKRGYQAFLAKRKPDFSDQTD